MPLIAVQRNLARFGGMLEMALIAFCGCLLTAIFVSVFTGVVVRYVSMVPWSWTEEVARFCLVWFAPMAAAIGTRRGSHFAFQWALLPFSMGTRRAVRQIGNVLIIAFLLLMLKLSLGFVDVMSNQTSWSAEIDMRIPVSGLVVGFAALLIMHVLEVADAALAVVTGKHFSIRELHEIEEMRLLEAETDIVHTAILPAAAK
jgi:TRAP-type C4-dicarboxylate transport system permease small subunit